MSGFALYCILKLDAIHGLLVCSAIISIIAMFVTASAQGDAEKAEEKDQNEIDRLGRCCKKWGIAFLVTTAVAIALPSTKDALVIYTVPKITQNEKVAIITDSLLDALVVKAKNLNK